MDKSGTISFISKSAPDTLTNEEKEISPSNKVPRVPVKD
jgi:hypothetical protein